MEAAARRSLGKDGIKFRSFYHRQAHVPRLQGGRGDVAAGILQWRVPRDTRPHPSAVLLNFGWHLTGSEPWPVEEVAGLVHLDELRDTLLTWKRTTQVTPL